MRARQKASISRFISIQKVYPTQKWYNEFQRLKLTEKRYLTISCIGIPACVFTK
jgi:hypothetical protein